MPIQDGPNDDTPIPPQKRRLAFYVAPPLRHSLAATGDWDAEGNRSQRINTVCDRYESMYYEMIPSLTMSEWLCLCDLLNGTATFEKNTARMVWAEVADAPEYGAKWGVDTEPLANTLRALSDAERFAVCEVVERVWGGVHNADASMEEILLHEVGAENIREGGARGG